MSHSIFSVARAGREVPAEDDSPGHRRPYRPKWHSWRPTSIEQAIQAEKDVLQCIDGKYQQCTLAGLNTIFYDPSSALWAESEDPESQERTPIILLHGFGGGCALWVGIWQDLIDAGYAPYSIDVPGFGRSRAVPFNKTFADDVVHYFVSQLEAWVCAADFRKPFVLVGHSLGAYIATHLAAANKDKIRNLILADPWGIPEVPRKHQMQVMKSAPALFRGVFSMFTTFPPLAMLRSMGPLGPRLLPKWRPTFADGYRDIIDDPHILYDYIFHMNSHPPHGEIAFVKLMEGPACAKRPIEREFDDLFGAADHTLPIAFIYGQNTWMDVASALRLQKRYSGPSKVFSVPDAGHQVFQDQPKRFVNILLQYLADSSISTPVREE